MPKVIKFRKDEDDGTIDNSITVNKEFCVSCGNSLDLWTSSDGVAYGVCSYCDLGIGSQPIVLVKGTEQ